MSNAYAGYFIGGGRDFTPALPLGIAAAGLFLMAGMALNDVADAEVDRRERPERPIPSGAIRLGTAWGLSLGMMVLGLVLLALANPLSALAGAGLCAVIFAYNFRLKGTFFGPVSMGLCRTLNLFTGMTLTWTAFPAPAEWSRGSLVALASILTYIALVTYLAKDEVQGNSRKRTKVFLAGLVLWFILWSVAALVWFKGQLGISVVWLALAMMLREPLRNLAADASPKHTGKTIGAMLRFLPLLDVMGMLACGVPLEWALAGALWIVPAFVVGKWFYST